MKYHLLESLSQLGVLTSVGTWAVGRPSRIKSVVFSLEFFLLSNILETTLISQLWFLFKTEDLVSVQFVVLKVENNLSTDLEKSKKFKLIHLRFVILVNYRSLTQTSLFLLSLQSQHCYETQGALISEWDSFLQQHLIFLQAKNPILD